MRWAQIYPVGPFRKLQPRCREQICNANAITLRFFKGGVPLATRYGSEENYMVEIFVIQLVVAALGAISTALADRVYNRGGVGLRLHTVWTSASIAMIYVPILWWTASIFLGHGLPAKLLSAMIVGAIFFSVYRNLPKPRSAPPRSRGAAPPLAKSSG